VRGLGGAGESSVWAQPEAAMPCMQGLPRAVPSARVRQAKRQHGSCVQARRLRPEGVSGFALPGVSLLDSMTFRPDWQSQRTWSLDAVGSDGSRSAVPESRKRRQNGKNSRNRSTRTRGGMRYPRYPAAGGAGGAPGAVRWRYYTERSAPPPRTAPAAAGTAPVPGRHVTIYYYYETTTKGTSGALASSNQTARVLSLSLSHPASVR
jgi:hypothetical protein